MEDDKVKKSLKYSILDGVFYSSMVGFGESFFLAFATLMNATSTQLGLLGSLPNALGGVSQLFSNRLTRFFNSRKKFVCLSVFVEGLFYIPIALVFFLGTLRIYLLIVFVCIYWILGQILNPAWSSWMGDLVDPKERGAYFGKRNKIAGLTTFATFLAGGYLLQYFSTSVTTKYIGFALIFSLALVSRIFSFLFLTKKYEPPYNPIEKEEFTLLEFVKEARHRNYGLFVLYLCLMNLAVYASAPFFSAYMLYDLKFGYLTFTIVTASSLLVKYLCMPLWGRFSDRYGTRKVLSLTGFLMPLVPILWLFSADIYYLLIIQFYSGFVWAGFELSSFNFIFDTTTPQRRATCVAYYNALNGAAIFLGAMLGAVIVRYNSVFWSKYLLIFMFSGLMRYCASFIFVPRLKEVREVEHIPYSSLLFQVSAAAPTMGVIHNVMVMEHQIVKLERKSFDITKKTLSKSKSVVDENIKRINKTIYVINEDVNKEIQFVHRTLYTMNNKIIGQNLEKLNRKMITLPRELEKEFERLDQKEGQMKMSFLAYKN